RGAAGGRRRAGDLGALPRRPRHAARPVAARARRATAQLSAAAGTRERSARLQPCGGAAHKLRATRYTQPEEVVMTKVQKTDAEWKQELTPEQYHVLREAGTERPGTGALLHEQRDGSFACAA